MHTSITESQIEIQINQRLENLNWKLNPADPLCNVTKQNVKTTQQKKALNGKIPDYVLYDPDHKPLIIIEAKRPGIDIEQARTQGITYAKRLQAPIVFATNGSYTTSWHVAHERPLELNKNELNDFISQAIAIHYRDNYTHFTEDEKVIKDKEELIPIFKKLNDHFHEAGIPAGRPRIELFCNFLFLKLISELSVQKDSIIRAVPISKTWGAFTKKYHGQALYEFINDTAYHYFKQAYGGEVLSHIKINAGKYEVLDKIVTSLDGLVLNPIRTDIKGDAFEFFLRNYGGADTDFGEYFTPRHIVEAIVAILNPQIGEKIYDPFCGTGGMLTYSYRHIHDSMAKTPNNIHTLKQATVYGGELTDMSRVAKMNMILAGDGHSNILQQDSYATPQRGKYDVIITNMPFGSKMKTPYAHLYNYNTQKAEIVGILHCLDALSDNPNARAGILVPEGILFNRTNAYKELRRALTQTYSLENIISLPSGLFGKNTGVKSNILIIKKHPQPQKKHIWYFNLKNDGLTLDAHRRKLKGPNDIDTISSETDLRIEDSPRLKKLGFSLLYKDKIKKQDHILLPGHYQDFQLTTQYKMVELEEVADFIRGIAFGKEDYINKKEDGYLGVVTTKSAQKKGVNYNHLRYVKNEKIKDSKLLQPHDILMSIANSLKLVGRTTFIDKLQEPLSFGAFMLCIRAKQHVLPQYLYACLNSESAKKYYLKKANTTTNISNLNPIQFQIPLPSLEEQKRIVEELESYQTIIHSAQKIIDSWKPFFKVDNNWKFNQLINLLKNGQVIGKKGKSITKNQIIKGNIPVIAAGKKSPYCHNESNYKGNIITVSASGAYAGFVAYHEDPIWASDCSVLYSKSEKILSTKYLYYVFKSKQKEIYKNQQGTGQPHVYLDSLHNWYIPIPALQEQQNIVAELEAERTLITHQKQVITTFEAKIQKRLHALWQQ